MTIEYREILALAQGWNYLSPSPTFPTGSWVSLVGKSRLILPDPETNPAELLALIEWTRKQEWLDAIYIHRDGVHLFGHGFSYSKEGPFNEAFPKAVIAVLQQMEEKNE